MLLHTATFFVDKTLLTKHQYLLLRHDPDLAAEFYETIFWKCWIFLRERIFEKFNFKDPH